LSRVSSHKKVENPTANLKNQKRDQGHLLDHTDQQAHSGKPQKDQALRKLAQDLNLTTLSTSSQVS